MTTAADTAFRSLALDLLNAYGTTAAYTHRSAPVYDPNTSSNTFTSTAANPKVYIDNPSSADIKAGVLKTERSCLLAGSAVSFYPSPEDLIVVDGETYRVRPVKPFYSGDQVALWLLGLSK